MPDSDRPEAGVRIRAGARPTSTCNWAAIFGQKPKSRFDTDDGSCQSTSNIATRLSHANYTPPTADPLTGPAARAPSLQASHLC